MPIVRADDLTEIRQRGSVNIGVKDSSPPFSLLDPKTKTVTGYDIEVALAVSKRLGVKPVLKTLGSDQRIPMLKNRTVDLIVADFARTAEREKQIDFSIGYFVAEEKLLAKVGRFKSPDDLKGATIGINSGSSLAAELPKEYPAARFVTVPDKPDLTKQLNAGLVDGIAASVAILTELKPNLRPAAGFEFAPFSLSVKSYGVGLRQGQNGLRKAINDALIDMEKSGEAEKIYNRWFGPNSDTPIPRSFRITG